MRFATGQGVPRTEDPRLLKGNGRYSDDFSLPGQAYAVFVRSTEAHARILDVHTQAALTQPGVLAVMTGADWQADKMGTINGSGLPGAFEMYRRNRQKGWYNPPYPPLEGDVVRHVGQPLAVVIATSRKAAEEAAALVQTDYATLPAIVDTAAANDVEAPQVWPECERNEAFIFEAGDAVATAAAIDDAPHVFRQRLVINRVHASPMEPRSVLASYSETEGRYTVHVGTQMSFVYRALLARVLGVKEEQVRVITGDLGGAFGMKNGNAEAPTLAWASRRLGRPVKWTCTRSESFVGGDYHGRDNLAEAELATDETGRFLAFRVHNTVAIGSHLSTSGAMSAVGNIGTMAGVYTTPAMHVKVTGVFSNTVPLAAYRGAGRPEAAYCLERMVDLAARGLNMDPVEIRRRNLIPDNAFPYKTPLVFTYDCGEFGQVLQKCVEVADYEGFPARREASGKKGRLRGIGVAMAIEIAARQGFETAQLRFGQGGSVTLLIGSTNHGQGHETIYAQLLHEYLGVAPERLRVVEGDTDQVPFGFGTGGSRTSALGSGAVVKVMEKCVAKGRKIAAQLLQADEASVEFGQGSYRVTGKDEVVAFADVVKASFNHRSLPEGVDLGMFETATYASNQDNFPNGCHICEVEIDPETGEVDILAYSVVDDVGTELNPMLVKGQIYGGVAQSVGQVLMEHLVYDSEGQVVSGSFMDYALPRAEDLCNIQTTSHPVPTASNPLGAKGVGESGTVVALPVLVNAICNALDLDHLDMPATPQRIWRAIRHKSIEG